MADTIELEFDILPGGMYANGISMTLRVTFEYEPRCPASFLYPPLPAEPASIEIIDLKIKTPGPNFPHMQIDPGWEEAPSCFDEMVREILLDEIGDQDG